jgi:hypothetical protein
MGTDMNPGDQAEWIDSVRFEATVHTENSIDHPDDAIWLRFRGTLHPLVVITDTVLQRESP